MRLRLNPPEARPGGGSQLDVVGHWEEGQRCLALFIEGCCEEGIMDRVLEESGLEVQVTANAENRTARQDTVSVPVNMVPHAQAVAG